jgi:hypothetical protein
MKQLFYATLILNSFASIAFAKIGETEGAISARYGQSLGDIPTAAFGKVRGFQSSGYVIGVKFVNGVSVMEMFSKTNQSDMSAAEIDKLLKIDREGAWKAELMTGRPAWRRWRQEDAGLVALYDAARHFLYINSKQFYDDQGKKIEMAKPEPPQEKESPPASFTPP